MATVTITGNAWEHNDQPVSAALRPELWFRPVTAGTAHGLQTHREVKATLATDGSFSVRLERFVAYIPVMRWLVSASMSDETIENRALRYCEWSPFTAVVNGDIGVQQQSVASGDVWWVSRSAPPAGFKGFWLVSDPSVTPSDKASILGDVRWVY